MEKEESVSPSSSDNVNEVFEFWRVRMGHTRARLDQKRRQKIRQRLLDGYTTKDLTDAVEGCALSPFHMGKNDRDTVFNDIELICRDAKHVDSFIKIKTETDARKARAVAVEKFQREEEERRIRERAERRGFSVVKR